MSKRGFKSDVLRNLYDAAIRQGWQSETGRKSGHAYAYCPLCPYREAFSTTWSGHGSEPKMKVNVMRKHGFVWKGIGGAHTAPIPDKDGKD